MPTQPDAPDDSQTADDPKPQPTCFVIAPIGRNDTETRKRSDQILRHIIDPVVTEAGYAAPLRADKISESGRITRQVIDHIVEDDLVIADLTDSNPNVYYELALRHAIGKPFVQILAGDDKLPFDVADQRTIMVDYRDLDSVAQARDELGRQVAAFVNGHTKVDTPLSFALDLASLRGSDNPEDRTQAEIVELLQDLRATSRRTYTAVRHRSPDDGADVLALRRFVEVVTQAGNIVDEDVDRLITQATTPSHDEWVEDVVRARMDHTLPVSRDGYSEESPF